MDIRKVVGANVLRLRRKQSISQEELSFRSGFGRAYLSGLERGKRNPTIITVSELASALGATLHDLVCILPGASDAVGASQTGPNRAEAPVEDAPPLRRRAPRRRRG